MPRAMRPMLRDLSFEHWCPERIVGSAVIVVLVMGSLFNVEATQAQHRLWQTFTSPNATDYARFGGAVASVGDITGNDVPDVLVGAAPESVDGAAQAGRAYVVNGATGDTIQILESPNVESGGLFGTAVAGIDDVDDDGTPDVLVGAEGETVVSNEDSLKVAGRVYLFSGESGTHLRTFQSPRPQRYARFGGSISATPDANGDGVPEVLIGAFVETVDGIGGAGRVYLMSGNTAETLQTAVSDQPESYGLFGISLASVGDVTGNDSADVLVGAPGETVRDSSDGRAYLFAGGGLTYHDTFESPNGTTEGNFGRAVAKIGDVNADGRPDLGVGAPGEFVEMDSAGRAYVIDGTDNTVVETISSPSPDSLGGFGTALSGVNDVDEDGTPDLLVGAPGESVDGIAAGRAYLVRGTDGSVYETLSSPSPQYGGDFGIAVADVGRAGSDRSSDVVVSANKESVDDVTQAGRTYMYTSPPSPPSGLTVEAQSDGRQVNWEPVDDEFLAGYRVYRDTSPIDSTAGSSSYTAIGSTSAGTTSFVDTSTVVGGTLYYRVTAVTTTGVESSFSPEDHVFVYPDEVIAQATRTFGDANEPGDYELVALPGDVSRPLSETLDGEVGIQWQAYWDNGTSLDFLKKYDGSERFELRPGRGFWVTSTREWRVEERIPTVQLEGDSATTIRVHDGWNIISNPFGRDVQWSSVKRATNADLNPLWAFGNTFVQDSIFASAQDGTAYYFRNAQGLDSLVVPYPGAPKTTNKFVVESDPLGLALTAQPKQEEASSSTIRIHLSNARGQDDAPDDIVAPPSQFSALSLRIDTEGHSHRGRLAEATRALDGEGYTFPLRLRNRTSDKIQIETQGLRAVEPHEVVLVHPKTGQSHDLRRESTVLLPESRRDRSKFELAIGTKRYVERQQERAIPDEVSLTAYPNPVREQATLSYSVPEEKDVQLVLYDVLGRRVKVLAQGPKRVGKHRVTVDVEPLASGVYFGRLQAGQERRVQKITVLR